MFSNYVLKISTYQFSLKFETVLYEQNYRRQYRRMKQENSGMNEKTQSRRVKQAKRRQQFSMNTTFIVQRNRMGKKIENVLYEQKRIIVQKSRIAKKSENVL